jgi:hypothetical protein
MKEKQCKKCHKAITILDEFPGGMCLACYERNYNATPQDEEQAILNVFKNGGAINKKARL